MKVREAIRLVEGDGDGRDRGPRNFGAYAPDLPGCVATADTLEECEALMREAIAFHLESMREYGDPIPVPTIAAASFVPAA
jgi:predicted RNase H-like HicB family nuclease